MPRSKSQPVRRLVHKFEPATYHDSVEDLPCDNNDEESGQEEQEEQEQEEKPKRKRVFSQEILLSVDAITPFSSSSSSSNNDFLIAQHKYSTENYVHEDGDTIEIYGQSGYLVFRCVRGYVRADICYVECTCNAESQKCSIVGWVNGR